ncbi:MFS general substrate transporter [Rhizodiscina lignyota]|uniref:MFS general substrate transporter n=1 Tax=Rhizodiscina lignyota TaxID=1504668 RepID=A0A9P4IBX2_9PEZI|nr:MFS general substrate transporter [Rhizodiscina lignyota]
MGAELGETTTDKEGSIYIVDKQMERRLLRKFDFYILPLVALMYLFNSIDKSNLGNAKTDNLEKDLHFHGNQYNILLSIFYVPFVLSGPPMNMLTKRFGASIILPSAMFIFGAMAMISAACKNFGGIVTTRWFLGMAESGFYPVIIFYLTTFYKRRELAGRLSLYYAASSIAGAFTGLIAFGVFQIDGHIYGWQYLFLIEGSLTICGAILGIIFLPQSAAKAYFLTEEEKKLAYHRIAEDSSVTVDAKFNIRFALRIFIEDRLWPLYMAIGFCVGVPLYSVSNFLPQIVARLGFSTVKTNLYTVAPNIVGSVFLIGVAFSSDFFGDRSLHLAFCMTLTFIGFTVLAAIDVAQHIAVGYFCCFLLGCGAYISSPLLSTWYNNNTPDENQRAILTPVLVASANAMGLVSSNIFRPQDAPNYVLASIVSAAFAGVGAILALSVGLYMKYDNMKRNREQGVVLRAGDVPTKDLRAPIHKDPNWRWMGGVP